MRNITIAFAVIIAVILGGLFFVRQASSPNDNTGTIGATIFPVYDITNQIAGEQFDVVLLLPPGSSPHTYEPTPSVLQAVEGAPVIFGIGEELDTWAQGIASASRSEFVSLEQGITLREFGEAHEEDHDEHEDEEHEDEHGNEDHDEDEHEAEEHADHHHGEHDPHYWLDPNNAIIMANTIAAELAEQDPANESVYKERAEKFASRLTRFDESFTSRLADAEDTAIITFHDAFGYFADHYGVNVVATVEPFPGQQPTPQYLAELQETIRDTGAEAIFIEPQLSTEGIAQFAGDNNVRIGTLDPLGGVEGRDTYIGLLQYNVEQLREALR